MQSARKTAARIRRQIYSASFWQRFLQRVHDALGQFLKVSMQFECMTMQRNAVIKIYTKKHTDNFILSSLWSKSDSQLSKYRVVCEIS